MQIRDFAERALVQILDAFVHQVLIAKINNFSQIYLICFNLDYTGIRCEVAVVSLITTTRTNSDFCSFRPCMNGGSCININNPNVNPPYACVCPSSNILIN